MTSMKRYKDIRVGRVDRGRVYELSFTDSFQKDVKILTTYTPRIAERFDNIANKFYGDSNKWFIIARANNEVKGRLFATPGKRLIIPKL